MSGKLDQALDDIVGDRRGATGGRRGGGGGGRRQPGRVAGAKAKAAIAAPAGGVQKKARAAKAAPVVPVGPATGDSKIIVSNLPDDVTESQLKVR